MPCSTMSLKERIIELLWRLRIMKAKDAIQKWMRQLIGCKCEMLQISLNYGDWDVSQCLGQAPAEPLVDLKIPKKGKRKMAYPKKAAPAAKKPAPKKAAKKKK